MKGIGMRSTMRSVLLAAAMTLAGPVGVAAQNASAEILPGDTIHGNIVTPGAEDRLQCFLAADSVVSIELLATKGSTILPALVMLDPDGSPLDISAYTKAGPGGVGVRVRSAPVGSKGGTFTLVAQASEGTAGRYTVRLKAKMPRALDRTLELPPGETTLPFDAPAGSTLSFSLALAEAVDPGMVQAGLRRPDGGETPLEGLSGKRVALDVNGGWSLVFDNQGATTLTGSARLTFQAPPASRRVLHLSPEGFGPAAKVRSVTPMVVLDDRVAVGIEVHGSEFEPGAKVRLERGQQAPVVASNLAIVDGFTLTADFDVTGISPGRWNLVVENPNGGSGKRALMVKSASSVNLPSGLRPDTEVWWLDFDDEDFPDDLEQIGLGSHSGRVGALCESAVKAYALYWLRLSFGLEPRNGKFKEGAVPVSFCLSRPPSTVGSEGTDYNRLHIGGSSEVGDPSSNPNYAWGDGPLDAGNSTYDNIHGDANSGWGVKTGALLPGNSAAGYYNAILPLLNAPLTSADASIFDPGYVPETDEERKRYREVTAAVNAVGREVGGTVAHFVARAMGIPDGASGLSRTPSLVGEFATDAAFSFSASEVSTMAGSVRAGLPGKTSFLVADHFPLRETASYLLPEATTNASYEALFEVAGGRPDRESSDMSFNGVSGSIPLGFSILAQSGGLSGTSPLRNEDNSLRGGVFLFVASARDEVSDEVVYFAHRLNLLVDVNDPSLSATEVSAGDTLNSQTLNTP